MTPVVINSEFSKNLKFSLRRGFTSVLEKTTSREKNEIERVARQPKIVNVDFWDAQHNRAKILIF